MKTSARMFLIFTAFGVIAGVLYAIATREFAGLFLFFAFGVANVVLAVLMLMAGDPEETKRKEHERGHTEEYHEAHLPPPSIWPAVIALGTAVLGWGTLLKPPIVVAGGLIILVGVIGWAGGFRSVNRDLAGWGEVWRHRQYQNIAQIQRELEEASDQPES